MWAVRADARVKWEDVFLVSVLAAVVRSLWRLRAAAAAAPAAPCAETRGAAACVGGSLHVAHCAMTSARSSVSSVSRRPMITSATPAVIT